jgi:ribosome-binding factor A
MIEGKRQKQVAAVLEEYLNEIFQKKSLTVVNGGMLSISAVKITPDLFDARVYLSMFKIDDKEAALQKVNDMAWEIKKELTAKVRHQLRSMPNITYYIDDTLDYVDKIEDLFKQIKNDEAPKQ